LHYKPSRGHVRNNKPKEDDKVATIAFLQNAEVISGTDGVNSRAY